MKSRPLPLDEAANVLGIAADNPRLALRKKLVRIRKSAGVDLLVRMNSKDAGTPRYGVHLGSLRKYAPELFGDVTEVEAIEQNTDALVAIGRKLKSIDDRIDAVEMAMAGIREALKMRPFRRMVG